MTLEDTYGDVTGEYLALRAAAGFFTGLHELVWVRGPDTVAFLDGLVSQSVAPLPAGGVARSLLLAPNGKLRAPLWLLRGENEVGLIVDVGHGHMVVEDLTRFKIRVDAEIVPPEPLLELWGPESVAVMTNAAIGVPEPHSWRRSKGTVLGHVPFARVVHQRYMMSGVPAAALESAGATMVGKLAVTAVRIEAGEPRMGIDVDEKTIPQEGALVDGAVDFAKGCYLGQELVARIDSRGHVNRHLRGLVILSNVLPPVGASLSADGKEVGAIGSIGESLELRAPVALALVRREVAPGDEVSVVWDGGEVAAEVRDLPLDDFAATTAGSR